MNEPDSRRSAGSAEPGGAAEPHRGGNAPEAGRATDPAQDSRAEQVLAQALRVMAGGGKPPPKTDPAGPPARLRRLSTAQLILLAVIIGLLIGVVAGVISVL
ncbi:MAG: hypothetical protein ABWZ98_08775 [Nakamurella sp.]